MDTLETLSNFAKEKNLQITKNMGNYSKKPLDVDGYSLKEISYSTERYKEYAIQFYDSMKRYQFNEFIIPKQKPRSVPDEPFELAGAL